MCALQSKYNRIIWGDCLDALPKLPMAKLVFADPPDNIRAPYKDFDDHWKDDFSYSHWLQRMINVGITNSRIFWMSYNVIHSRHAWKAAGYYMDFGLEVREILWRYTFGQCNTHDSTGGYRPMMRIRGDRNIKLYPDAIKVESARQKLGDRRAKPGGRVPDAVWDFPRIVGNAKERVKWATTQHPQKLMERIIKLCCKPGDLVIDMFGHSFTTARVCERLGIKCISIEIDKYYCHKGAKELNCKVTQVKRRKE